MRFKSPLLSLLVLLLIALSVAGQTDEKERAQKENEKRQELERKTLAMLDEVATQALSLKLPENRSMFLTNAADLLWTHDERRARSLFWDALNNLASPATNSPGDESAAKDSTVKDSAARDSTKDSAAKRSANEKARTLNQYFATFNARQEFLRKVARRDPQLALDMLRATRLWNDLNSLAAKSTPEELSRAPARTSGDMRREVYQAAVMNAVMKGKADALREFIKREVGDEGQRNSLNDLLDEQQLGWAVNHGNTEELQKLLPLIRLKEKRAEAMAEIAMLLEKKGEHDEGAEAVGRSPNAD